MSNDCMPRREFLRQQAQGTAEVPDPTPVEASLVPAPLTLREEMRRFIRQELSARADERDMETFEESDDFEVEEEPDFTTGYTVHELVDPELEGTDLDGDPAADTTEPLTPSAEPGLENTEEEHQQDPPGPAPT